MYLFCEREIKRMSSWYGIKRTFNLLRIDTSVSISFVKILGAEESPKHRKRNWYNLSSIETLRIFESPCEEGLKIRHLWDPVCRKNYLFLQARSKEKASPS